MTRSLQRCICTLTFFALLPISARGQEPAERSEDGWTYQRDKQTGILVQTKEMTLHPRAAPQPALKNRLLLDSFERTPGNAALFYLKAMGFFEQRAAQERIRQFEKEMMERAKKEGKSIGDLPPYNWLEMSPDELPVEEVKKYLPWVSFQQHFIREGVKRSHFDMNRNFREVEDPIGYLLPEIQELRQLARMQSLRCRLAIAEDRIDDAIEIVGQQFALGQHLSDDDFLVCNLVGIAITSIGWNDALYIVQHPKAQNLYWALATMPRPLVSLKKSMAIERQFLYQQLKVLKEVDERPRPAGYWQDFIDRLLPQLGYLATEFEMPSVERDPKAARAALVAYVAAAYPGAKRYLIERQKLPASQVEAYPTAQVVFLAMARFYDHWRDELFKWTHIPFWQARTKMNPRKLEQLLREDSERWGWCAMPTRVFLPAILAARTAEARCDQTIALLQAVEALRMYAAEQDGKLPPTLDALSVPAPVEPFTGKQIRYELLGDRAVLTGHVLPGLQYRLVVRIAK